MRLEHLRQWLQEAEQKKDPDANQWLKEVTIVQVAFHDYMLNNESTWQTVVLIPKGVGGEFWGIGLVKFLWKTVTGILNHRSASEIQLHEFLYGFWGGRITGTAVLEDKLLQQLPDINKLLLYKVFLDLQKSYNTLDWNRCLKILVAYRVGPRALRILRT